MVSRCGEIHKPNIRISGNSKQRGTMSTLIGMEDQLRQHLEDKKILGEAEFKAAFPIAFGKLKSLGRDALTMDTGNSNANTLLRGSRAFCTVNNVFD